MRIRGSTHTTSNFVIVSYNNYTGGKGRVDLNNIRPKIKIHRKPSTAIRESYNTVAGKHEVNGNQTWEYNTYVNECTESS